MLHVSWGLFYGETKDKERTPRKKEETRGFMLESSGMHARPDAKDGPFEKDVVG